MTAAAWDMAGPDGRTVAAEIFGPEARRLSVWQSLDKDSLSLLRLGEGNFRIFGYDGSLPRLEADLHAAAHGRQVWIKRCRMAMLTARDGVEALLPLATVKPPHRMAGLPADWALPVRIEGRAVLLWRHRVHEATHLEIQAACADASAVSVSLSQVGLHPVSLLADDGVTHVSPLPRTDATDTPRSMSAPFRRIEGETP